VVDLSFLPFSRPSLGPEEEAELLSVVRSGWLTAGPRVSEFERVFAGFLGVPQALALSSCTAALHLAYTLAGIGHGDEVLLPSLTFASTANMVLMRGATPVFVDVATDTLTLSVSDMESKMTARTRAVVAVDYGGTPCDYDALAGLCERHNVTLIADAAHSCGAEYKGRKVGTLADFTCFSFYANKNMTTGEGGALVARDPAMLSRARVLALHGMDRDAWKRYDRAGTWRYAITELGYKYNFTDLQAALGLHQLRKLPEFNARRRVIVDRYRAGLVGLPARVLAWPKNVLSAAHLAVLLVAPAAPITRDALIEALRGEGIGTSVHFIPLHTQPLYVPYARPLPQTEGVFPQILSLPLFPAMGDADVDRVVAALRRRLG
jgi:dTDP-4-amino-4,6-dideoxygalactose transaminase